MGRWDLKTVAVVLATVVLSGSAWAAQDPGEIWVGPEAIYDAAVGQTVTVTLRTNISEPSGWIPPGGYDIEVRFDPAVLQFVSSKWGNIWRGYTKEGVEVTEPTITFCNGTTDLAGVDHPDGYFLYAATPIAVWKDQIPGPAVQAHSIVTLTFLVVGEGITSFAFGSYEPAFQGPIFASRQEPMDKDVEFIVRDGGFVSTYPDPLTNLAQSAEPAGTPMVEGFVDTDGFVYMRAELTAGATPLMLEVEVKPLAEPFDGLNLIRGNPVEAATGVSEVTTAQLADGSYHWRVRVVSDTAAWSPWTEFATDPAADFVIAWTAPPAPAEKERKVCGLSAATRGASTGILAAAVLALLLGWRLVLNR